MRPKDEAGGGLRISYRALGPQDLGALSDIVGHWEVVRQLGSFPWPADPVFNATRAQAYQGDGFVWAILRDGGMVGTVAVTGDELGYMLHPGQWRQGIGRRAVGAALAEAFGRLGRGRIVADVWADNAASLGVLAGFGFVRVRDEVVMSKARGVPTASCRLELTRTAWEAHGIP